MTKKRSKKKKEALDDRACPTFEMERWFVNDDDEDVSTTVVIDVHGDLAIDRDHLDDELGNHAQVYASYAKLKEEARTEMKRAKYKLHCIREDRMGKYRQEEVDRKTAKNACLSETQMKAKINRDKHVRMAIEHYMDKTNEYRTLDEYVKALDQRGRMLQSINANRNTEYNTTR